MSTLRSVLEIVLWCSLLAAGLVLLYYVGLARRWWW